MPHQVACDIQRTDYIELVCFFCCMLLSVVHQPFDVNDLVDTTYFCNMLQHSPVGVLVTFIIECLVTVFCCVCSYNVSVISIRYLYLIPLHRCLGGER